MDVICFPQPACPRPALPEGQVKSPCVLSRVPRRGEGHQMSPDSSSSRTLRVSVFVPMSQSDRQSSEETQAHRWGACVLWLEAG